MYVYPAKKHELIRRGKTKQNRNGLPKHIQFGKPFFIFTINLQAIFNTTARKRAFCQLVFISLTKMTEVFLGFNVKIYVRIIVSET